MSYESYLEHHGVLGMKWGVRRYQNADGTLTNAGKERYNSDGHVNGLSSERKQQLVKGAKYVGVTAATAITAAYIYKHPGVSYKLIKGGKEFVANHKDDVVSGLKTAGKAVGDRAKKAAVRAGNAALDGAMLSVGTIVISKLTKRFEAKDTDTERQKIAKKVALDSSVAAVNSFTKASKSGGNSNNKGNQLGKDEGARISSIVGAPKKEPVDRSGSSYQALFKDSSGNNRSSDERSIIKSMASAGYSIDQIQQYLDTLGHSGVNMYTYSTFYPDELYHHGIKGMHWGVRRFQNPDGSLIHPKLGFNRDPERAALRKEYRTAKREFKKAHNEYTAPGSHIIKGFNKAITSRTMSGKLSGFARAAYGMYESSDKEKMRQSAKRNKEAFDRYMNATAKYKGISNKEARRRHANSEFRKGVIKAGISVASKYAAYKFKNDPNTQKAVKNVVRKGSKILANAIKAYTNRSINTLDKLEWGVVDAPGYTILN